MGRYVSTMWAWAMTKSHTYSLKYASDRAEGLSVTDPRGQAYSDMATVLTLSLDADGRRHLDGELPRWFEKA